MKPLCSVMIPSRKRVEGLLTAIDSVRGEATEEDYEILVRVDDDDEESLKAIPAIEGRGNTRVIVGPRLGYAQLDSGYYAGLEDEARGEFVWIAGDDMTVHGDWMWQLRKVPLTGYIVQPEISKLGGSTYPRAEGQAFPIFPRKCWEPYADAFPTPFDTGGSALLIENCWSTWFLEGVTFHHHEASPEDLEKHRAMHSSP